MENVLRVETRRLQCRLSDEELQGLSLELAQTFQDLEAEQERQAETRSEMKAALARLGNRMKELSTNIVSKSVPRDVDVEQRLQGLQVQEVRLDTGEIVFTRPATPLELQARFPGDEAAGPAS